MRSVWDCFSMETSELIRKGGFCWGWKGNKKEVAINFITHRLNSLSCLPEMHFFCIYYMESLISWSSKHVLCLLLQFWMSLPLKNLLLVKSEDSSLVPLQHFFFKFEYGRRHIVHMAFIHPGKNYSSHNLENYHFIKSKDFRTTYTNFYTKFKWLKKNYKSSCF